MDAFHQRAQRSAILASPLLQQKFLSVHNMLLVIELALSPFGKQLPDIHLGKINEDDVTSIYRFYERSADFLRSYL